MMMSSAKKHAFVRPAGLDPWHFLRWALLLAGVLACGVLGVDAAEPPHGLEQVPIERLAQIVAYELQVEDRRAPERLLSFHEFQDLADLDCVPRLVYLLNETVMTSRRIQAQHGDFMGLMGMFMPLLQQVPMENSWVWALTRAHERLLEQVNSYWSRVVTLALDQHHCLIPALRNVLLDAVVAWKKHQNELLALQWNGLAFGVYRDENSSGQPAGEGFPESIAAGNVWAASMREWFEKYASQLLTIMPGLEVPGLAHDGAGATRSHHQDEHGSFITYEFLRRKVFGQWAIDKGLLRGLLRHVWQPPHTGTAVSVADFGAGGGHYSSWLNETGLVLSFAFDGTQGAAELTGGVVQEVNLVQEMRLWRNFSWIMCLEVGEHIPKQFAGGLLRNLHDHAEDGLVMSWSDDWEGIGHVNCLSRDDFVVKVEAETGFGLDRVATEAVKASCEIEYIARTIAVFRRRA